MTSLLTSCHIQHVYWHYKSVYFIVTCHRQRSTKLSTTYANVWTHAFFARFGHFEHIMWTGLSRLIWHNFVKIGDNWIKICNLAKIRMLNRCVKNRLQILNRLWKKWKNVRSPRGGIFFDSHCRSVRQSKSACFVMFSTREQNKRRMTSRQSDKLNPFDVGWSKIHSLSAVIRVKAATH